MAVKVRQRKGAWWLFIDHQGRRKAKRVGVGDSGKKAAKEAAAKIQAKLALGEFQLDHAPVPTFQEYAEAWLLNYARAHCRESTASAYERLLRHYAFPRFGSRQAFC